MQGKSTIIAGTVALLAAGVVPRISTSARADDAAERGPGALLPHVRAKASELQPGVWVRYAMLPRGRAQALFVRLSALERKGPAQWFEVAITDGTRRLVFRNLIGSEPPRVLEALVQPPGQRPLLLPDEMAKTQLPPFASAAGAGPPANGRALGRQRVRVAAGTFNARHYRRRVPHGTEDLWLSDAVRGWPLVKLVNPKVVLELVAHGRDAKSQVSGKPLKFNPKLLRGLGLIR